MKHRQLLILLGLSGVLITAVFLSNAAQAVHTTTGASLVHTFELPVSSGSPYKLIVEQADSPAKIWFTIPDGNAIGQLVVTSTVDFAFQTYTVTTPNSEPYDLVFDAANDFVYFTEHAGNKLGRINVNTKSIDEYSIPNGDGPAGIDSAPNGFIWFVQDAANRVTSFNPATTTFTDYNYGTANALPDDIAVLNDDNIWFSAPGANNAVQLTPSKPEISRFSSNALLLIPGSPTFSPGGLVLDSALPWASAPTEGLIGRFAPGTLSLWRWYDVSTVAPSPTSLFYRANGSQTQIWFVDTANGKAGQLYTDLNGNLQSKSAIFMPGTDPQPTDIKLGTDGTAWIANNGSGTIVQWIAPYYNNLYLPFIVK